MLTAEQRAALIALLNTMLRQAIAAERLGFDASILRKSYTDGVEWIAKQEGTGERLS